MSTKNAAQTAKVTRTDIKQLINDTDFYGFKSDAEVIGELARIVYLLNAEMPDLYLSMQIMSLNRLQVFGENENHAFHFDNYFFHKADGCRFKLIDFCHFAALMIDEKRGKNGVSQ